MFFRCHVNLIHVTSCGNVMSIIYLCIFSLSPGGTAEGQTVTLTGQGFSDDVEATIYGN